MLLPDMMGGYQEGTDGDEENNMSSRLRGRDGSMVPAYMERVYNEK
jgi:hypothetical protein